MTKSVTIPPHDRHDRHEKSVEIPTAVLSEAAHRHGWDGAVCFRKLSGGFQNANYLAETPSQKIVLRFYSEGATTARLESGLLRFLASHNVRAPRLLNLLEWDNFTVVVLEFIEGNLLQDVLQGPVALELFTSVGKELARVHAIQFPRAGFVELPKSGFLGQITVGTQYESFGLFLREFIFKTLREVKPDRLDPKVRDRLVELVEDRWQLVLNTEPVSQLVHSDFNPKNIMVDPQGKHVAGILDWEFGLSGNGYIDLGNFFRFAGDYPPGADSAFIAGYELVHGPVDKHWREVALLLDIANMCSFLERRENYPKSLHTARTIIAGTLDFFAG